MDRDLKIVVINNEDKYFLPKKVEYLCGDRSHNEVMERFICNYDLPILDDDYFFNLLKQDLLVCRISPYFSVVGIGNNLSKNQLNFLKEEKDFIMSNDVFLLAFEDDDLNNLNKEEMYQKILNKK